MYVVWAAVRQEYELMVNTTNAHRGGLNPPIAGCWFNEFILRVTDKRISACSSFFVGVGRLKTIGPSGMIMVEVQKTDRVAALKAMQRV